MAFAAKQLEKPQNNKRGLVTLTQLSPAVTRDPGVRGFAFPSEGAHPSRGALAAAQPRGTRSGRPVAALPALPQRKTRRVFCRRLKHNGRTPTGPDRNARPRDGEREAPLHIPAAPPRAVSQVQYRSQLAGVHKDAAPD